MDRRPPLGRARLRGGGMMNPPGIPANIEHMRQNVQNVQIRNMQAREAQRGRMLRGGNPLPPGALRMLVDAGPFDGVQFPQLGGGPAGVPRPPAFVYQAMMRRRAYAGAVRAGLDKKEDKNDEGGPRMERMGLDGDILSYMPDQSDSVGVFIAAEPLTPENSYFEVEILDTGSRGAIGVGVVNKSYRLDRQPGWDLPSVGYHADDGRIFKADGLGKEFGPKCFAGDTIGCGIKFDQMEPAVRARQPQIPIFFTRNGKEIGTVQVVVPAGGIYPAVGMHSQGEEVRLNLVAEWVVGDEEMVVDGAEDDWTRLDDIRINGQLLEYSGEGKTMEDVGLAQAKSTLNQTHHYFELEIVNPGRNCYIAIGLARKNYPKRRHPGWNKGSIAYHADDGKIFIGSGMGDPFGPRCHKGDIMGCGIIFPVDYEGSDAESDKSEEEEPEVDKLSDRVENRFGPHLLQMEEDEIFGDNLSIDSDTEPEDLLEEIDMHYNEKQGGLKVKVFFTRNGKTVGTREVQIPPGGFYPTIGMLSTDEKVLVDLHPLTG